MRHKIFLLTGTVALLIIMGLCNDGNKGNPIQIEKPKGTKVAFGTFDVLLDEQRRVTFISGTFYDGGFQLSNVIWDIDTIIGNCRLYKKRIPVCNNCPYGSTCVNDDSCVHNPKKMSIDTVWVNGLKTSGGKTSFFMYPVSSSYSPDSGIAYPPCSEGDQITFIAQGDSIAAPCTLTAKGVSLINVLNDSIVVADGQPITIRWARPGAGMAGISTVFIIVDVSYHAGTHAKIECECPDTGSATIPTVMLDRLKTYGLSGFPRITISRRSIATNASGNTKLIIESSTEYALRVPGVISCNDSTDCPNNPNGRKCRSDKRCQ